jgi:hypothetical protein
MRCDNGDVGIYGDFEGDVSMKFIALRVRKCSSIRGFKCQLSERESQIADCCHLRSLSLNVASISKADSSGQADPLHLPQSRHTRLRSEQKHASSKRGKQINHVMDI